ncbi:Ribonuclease P, Rpp40 [Cinara cedri]|uniref:Ribonuclease P, Rpp40 n=1 Tax=Cinara cedri TaxID=506608 RepID=A0A5E4M8I8_9HEMI|nr:Ribonuclease P, Rpp40 [Cinara cedri]
MIEPELFNFKPSLKKHIYVKKRWDKILSDIDGYGLTHSISIVLPDTLFIPDHINNIFSENDHYYLIKNVTLCSLIDPGFITSFVKNGKVYAISLNTNVDVDDCISITNCNLLQMSLTHSSCQYMCLPSKDSKITLDLKELKFCTKSYQRLNECFQRYQNKFELLICWESNDDDVCPSSIASYFSKKGFDCQECFPRLTTERKYNMTIPKGDDIALLDTWLSYFCLGIHIDNKTLCVLPNGKLTKSNSCDVGQVTQIIWMGFFNNDKVKLLLEKFRDFKEKENKSYWLAIHLESFSNSPYPCGHRTIVLNSLDTYFVSNCINCKKF